MNEIKQISKALWEYESSVPYRIITCISAIFSSILTLWAIEWPAESLLIISLILVGSIFSFYFSKNKYIIVKIIISIFMIISLLNFFENFMTSPLGPAAPVALLLLWLQSLHSFDLPSSRDLKYSLVVSFILTTVGSFFIASTTYIIFAGIFLIVFAISNFYSNDSLSNNIFKKKDQKENIFLPAFVYSTVTIILGIIIGSIFFILLPRFTVRNVNIYNFAIFKNLNFINKRQESQSTSSSKNSSANTLKKIVAPVNGYFGFGESMDLNMRGTLSDEIVIKVKASYPSYYRGGVFTEYDGNKWYIKDPENPIEMKGLDNAIFTNFYPEDEKTQNIQTFNIEKDMSNIVYTANFCSTLYFPGNELYMGHHREIFSPYVLEKGMNYTCISTRPKIAKMAFKYKEQKSIGREKIQTEYYNKIDECLQLPEEKLSERLIEYSNKFLIYKDDFKKALAICEDLKNNYAYDLNVEKFPENAETADYFLFESKKGFCEHFATAMIVLCRLNGIPCRLVTGFTQGEFNPFSGVYEIKESDAHSWVEIITKYGVIELDPTPNYSSEITISNRTNIEYLLETISKNIEKITKSIVFKVIIYTIITILLIFTIFYIYKNRENINTIINRKKRENIKIETRKKISAEAKNIFKYLSKINIYKQEGQTINEFIENCKVLDDFKYDLKEYFKTYQHLRYSSQILQEDIESASTKSKDIINKIKKYGRKLCLT